MLHSLVTRRNAKTLPIMPLDADAYPAWWAKQGKARKAWIERSEFEPTGNRVLLVPGPKGPALAIFGRADLGPFSWAGAAQRLPPGRYEVDGALDPEAATEAAIGWALAHYDYRPYKAAPSKAPRELVWPKGADRKEATRVIGAIGRTRDLINAPAEDLGPEELAACAVELAKRYGARARVIKGKALRDGFPMVHAVGRGSARAPRLVDMRWGKSDAPTVTLVGKGVCFDSGGLDLKNASGMLRMKKDMGGAAIVLGLAELIMDAELPVQLRVLVPAVENLPGPGAYRPLDVLRSRGGATVEVSNTDAEGRLVLADALSAAGEEAPSLLIDVATLTGSARVALGSEISAFFTHDRKIADGFAKAARASRDPAWRLPLHKAYRRHLDSRVADLKNAASTSLGGSITAALFLSEFVAHPEGWLHLDVMGWNDHPRPGRPVGGEATGLRAAYRYLQDRFVPAPSPS